MDDLEEIYKAVQLNASSFGPNHPVRSYIIINFHKNNFIYNNFTYIQQHCVLDQI